MFQQQKAAPMLAHSPSLKEDQKSSGSGWVSLRIGNAHKSFVGSVDRESHFSATAPKAASTPADSFKPAGGDMDISEDEPGGVLVSNEKEEKKEMHYVLSAKSLNSMRALLSGNKQYRIRLSGATSGVSASSGQAVLLAAWDPHSIAEFVDFATLFTEYKVDNHELTVWSAPQASTSVSTLILCGSDPGSRISSPTSVNVRNLGDSKLWNPQSTKGVALSLNSGKKMCDSAVQATPLTRDGFQLTTDAWGGQSVIYAEVLGAGTSTTFVYQQTWTIDFRCRV